MRKDSWPGWCSGEEFQCSGRNCCKDLEELLHVGVGADRGWRNGWMDGLVNGWVGGCMGWWVDEWVDGWMGKWLGLKEFVFVFVF